MYKITIVKFIDNPKYDEEKKEYESRNRYEPVGCPQSHVEARVLEATVTDSEFSAVKKACLEVM